MIELVAELPVPPPPQAASAEAIAPASVSLDFEFMRTTPEKNIHCIGEHERPCHRGCLQQRVVAGGVDTGAEITDEHCVKELLC